MRAAIKVTSDINKLKTMGERMRFLRERNNLTREAMGKELDVTVGRILRYERDATEPGVAYIQQFCNRFEANLNWVVNGKGKPRDLRTEKNPLKMFRLVEEKNEPDREQRVGYLPQAFVRNENEPADRELYAVQINVMSPSLDVRAGDYAIVCVHFGHFQSKDCYLVNTAGGISVRRIRGENGQIYMTSEFGFVMDPFPEDQWPEEMQLLGRLVTLIRPRAVLQDTHTE